MWVIRDYLTTYGFHAGMGQPVRFLAIVPTYLPILSALLRWEPRNPAPAELSCRTDWRPSPKTPLSFLCVDDAERLELPWMIAEPRSSGLSLLVSHRREAQPKAVRGAGMGTDSAEAIALALSCPASSSLETFCCVVACCPSAD